MSERALALLRIRRMITKRLRPSSHLSRRSIARGVEGLFVRKLDAVRGYLHDLAVPPDSEWNPELPMTENHAATSRDHCPVECVPVREDTRWIAIGSLHRTCSSI